MKPVINIILTVSLALVVVAKKHHTDVTTITTISAPTPTPTPTNLFTQTCIVGGVSLCPSGSLCTQTMTCGGLCVPTPPPVISCDLGCKSACPHGSTCQLSTTCPPQARSSCGGTCAAVITTPPVPTTTTTSEGLHISCIIGNSYDCPSPLTCASTKPCPSPSYAGEICRGLCAQPSATSTVFPPPPSYAPCILGAYPGCPSGSACTQTEVCSGVCFPSPTTV